MHRFQKTSFFKRVISKIHWSLLLFFCVLILFLSGIKYITNTSVHQQAESLENVIYKDILHCYSVEGTYPPSLEYLKAHYGLTYDESLFFVDYISIGSNMMPDVTIITK